MFNRLTIRILVPIVALMLSLGASLYFGVLRTVDLFATSNIEKDLENLNHELFSILDQAYMHVVKDVKDNDKVAIRITQVDSLDIIERKTYASQFKIVVFDQKTGEILLASDLPGKTRAKELIKRAQSETDSFMLQTDKGFFHVGRFSFPPWDWTIIVLKDTRAYLGLTKQVNRVYLTSTLVLLIATSLLISWLIYSIKNPISMIISSLSKGAAPNYRGTYEFEFLSKSINDMRESLENELNKRQESEKRFRDLTENSSDWIWEVDQDLHFTYASPKVKDLLGYDPEEIIGKSPFDLMLPAEGQRLAENVAAIVESQQPFHNLENTNLHRAGKSVVLSTSGVPFFDSEGNFRGYRGIDRDITEKKVNELALQKAYEDMEERVEERTLELKKTYNQLLHAEKLATSGSIAASLAHEFGNPLYGIKGVLASINQQNNLEEESAKMLEMALSECERMGHLLQSLQDFNRPSSGEKTLTSLHQVIDDIVIFSRRNLERKSIDVKKDYASTLRPIMAITDQITQVIINLINNSIDACDKGGEIKISTREGESSTIIQLQDNGHGIGENDLPHIFEPFFSTKEVAMGTGLGLSVSYGIIRRHGGTIEVKSKPGEGTTFTITLPREGRKNE